MLRLQQVLRARPTANQARFLFNPASQQLFHSQSSEAVFSQIQQPESFHQTQEVNTGHLSTSERQIQRKTTRGRKLAEQIASEVPEDRFAKVQRFERFIDKMFQLQRSEQNLERKLEDLEGKLLKMPFYSKTPIKDILRTYNRNSSKVLEPRVMALTAESLRDAYLARGKAPEFTDYGMKEMDASWHMQKLAEDLIFVLGKERNEYDPHHLGRTLNALGDLGYKNTTLIEKGFEKLVQVAEGQEVNKTEMGVKEYNFGPGNQGFGARYNIFEGFQKSQEFEYYLKTLVDWQFGAQSKEIAQEKEVEELEHSMEQLINQALEIKEFQKDQTAAIDNLRVQYSLLKEAQDKHQFLQYNEYVRVAFLELQEAMVQGGFLKAEEADSYLFEKSFKSRMEEASQIFYDMASSHSNEILSPQHEELYSAVLETLQKKKEKAPSTDLSEPYAGYTLKSLALNLQGLSKMALSYRIDSERKDYLNKYHEKERTYLEEYERKIQEKNLTGKFGTVRMDRSLLRGWKIVKENTQKLLPFIREQVQKSQRSSELLETLKALGLSGAGDIQLQKEIFQKLQQTINTPDSTFTLQNAISGLEGLALMNDSQASTKEIATKICDSLQGEVQELTFNQLIDLAQAMSILDIGFAEKTKSLFDEVVLRLNEEGMAERIGSEMELNTFRKLEDIQNYLNLHEKSLTPFNLVNALSDSQKFILQNFEERTEMFDPIKQRVLKALEAGLAGSQIEHAALTKRDIVEQTKSELAFRDYPYKPDLMIGYNGQKIALFVINDIETNQNTLKARGDVQFRMDLIEKKMKGTVKCVALPVSQVLDFDLENMQIGFKSDFQLQNILNVANPLYFGEFIRFSHDLLKEMEHFIYNSGIPTKQDSRKLQKMSSQIYQIIHMKNQAMLKLEHPQRKADFEVVKSMIFRLNLLCETMSPKTQAFILNKTGSDSLKKFFVNKIEVIEDFLRKDKSNHEWKVKQLGYDQKTQLDLNWIGVRQTVEVPATAQEGQKNLNPELLNQRFLQKEDYFQYPSWKAKMKEVYDNFNLLVIPSNQNQDALYYNKEVHMRRTPRGIFPHPLTKRQISQSQVNLLQEHIQGHSDQKHDELALYEKEPLKLMLEKELQRRKFTSKCTEESAMITNLTNLKQSLKAEYSDSELVHFILDFEFTDALIDKHLNSYKATEGKLVEREASEYRQFVRSTYQRDHEDPFTEFYLKEAKKDQAIDYVYDQYKKAKYQVADFSESTEKAETMQEKLENMLLARSFENEDYFSLGHSIPKHTKIEVDVKSLLKTEHLHDKDPLLDDKSVSDQEFLYKQRILAESKLIKSKILHKLHYGKELTEKEQQYKKKWLDDLKNNRNLLDLRESMVPKDFSDVKISELSAHDLYALNSVPNVQFDVKQHGEYFISDIILELGHFLDSESVEKVELEIVSDKLKKEFKLASDYKLVESRNKEVSIALNYLEEQAWRRTGAFTNQEVELIKQMFSICRNDSHFDKQFFENDMKSLEDFLSEANFYDNRNQLLEEWLRRKEKEINSRVNLPLDKFKKTDKELGAKIRAQIKRARQNLVAKVLTHDEFGTDLNKQAEKSYDSLTAKELETITENLSTRLLLFNYEYPEFFKQIYQGVYEHPNLHRQDKQKLEIFAEMFEFDFLNRKGSENFLYYEPVHIEGENYRHDEPLTAQNVLKMIRSASTPFTKDLAQKL